MMTTVSPPVSAAKTGGILRLFLLYADFPASACARWAAAEITKIAGPSARPTAEMWKLDALTASAPIRAMISQDAAQADVIIVAVSSLEHRLPGLVEWLGALPAPESPRPRLLLGLFGDEENKSQELDWTVKSLIRCAQRAGRNFLWHWMEPAAMHDSHWLKDHVQELLRRKSAADREAVCC